MNDKPFDPDPVIEALRMPFHVASAFKNICLAAQASTPEDKLILMAAVQEHVDNELVRLRLLLQKPKEAPQPERLFGAVLDPDYGLAEEALSEAYQIRDNLRQRKDGGEK